MTETTERNMDEIYAATRKLNDLIMEANDAAREARALGLHVKFTLRDESPKILDLGNPHQSKEVIIPHVIFDIIRDGKRVAEK